MNHFLHARRLYPVMLDGKEFDTSNLAEELLALPAAEANERAANYISLWGFRNTYAFGKHLAEKVGFCAPGLGVARRAWRGRGRGRRTWGLQWNPRVWASKCRAEELRKGRRVLGRAARRAFGPRGRRAWGLGGGEGGACGAIGKPYPHPPLTPPCPLLPHPPTPPPQNPRRRRCRRPPVPAPPHPDPALT